MTTMERPHRPRLLAAPILLVLLAALAAAHPAAAGEESSRIVVHATQVMTAGHVVQQVIGPLPALAGTPFLGLAVLSGAALLSDTDAVRTSDNPLLRGFHDNALLTEARRYATPGLFLTLLGLSLLTYLVNSGKIRGAVGKLLRVGEDSSVLVTYVLLAAATLTGAGMAKAPQAARFQTFGFINLPDGILVSVGLAAGLVVMMTVRFAFDVIIWLTPIPLVDFTFETLKKLLSLSFLALYFLSPVAAAVLALVLLVPAVFIYGWATRILGFAFRIVLRPLLARLWSGARPHFVVEGLRHHAAQAGLGGEADLAVPAAALAARGLRRRAPGALVRTPAGLAFVSLPRLRRPRSLPLDAAGERRALGRALLWLELRVIHPDGRVDRYALPRTYAGDLDRLRAALGADDAGPLGAVRAFGSGPAGAAAATAP